MGEESFLNKMNNEFEINKLCRLCLAKEQVLMHIFEGEGYKEEIFLKISTCLPVNISYEDKLPKKICINCYTKLNVLYEFCNKSTNSEKQLLYWFNQCGTSNETPSDSNNLDNELEQCDSEIEVKEEVITYLNEDDNYHIKTEKLDDENYNMSQDILQQENEMSYEESLYNNESNADTNTTIVEVKRDIDDDERSVAPNLQTEINSRYYTKDEVMTSADDVAVPAKLRRICETSPNSRSKSCLREKNMRTYSRNKRKTWRNLGHDYISDSTKKHVNARELGLPCSCKNKCREKLEGSHEDIFSKFWDLGSYDLQSSYLFDCIQVAPKKRSYKKKQKRQESRRKGTACYMVSVNGKNTKICKTEFLNVHGLQSSCGRINRLVSNKIQGVQIPVKDRRGKHKNKANQQSIKVITADQTI